MAAGDIDALIQMLFAAYNKEASPDSVLAYAHALSDVPIRTLTMAIQKATQEERFLPSPAVIRAICFPSAAERSVIAWEAVLKAIPLGPYKHINFDDPYCNAAIRSLGGWPQFMARFRSAEEEKWARKDFIDTYQSMVRSKVSGDICRPLAGLAQKQVINGEVVNPVPRLVATGLPPIGIEHKKSQKATSISGLIEGSVVKRVGDA